MVDLWRVFLPTEFQKNGMKGKQSNGVEYAVCEEQGEGWRGWEIAARGRGREPWKRERLVKVNQFLEPKLRTSLHIHTKKEAPHALI